MDVLTLAMWIGIAIFLIFSFAKDKGKTKQALKMAFGMGKGMLGSILSIIFLIGLILTVFPPENICRICRQAVGTFGHCYCCRVRSNYPDSGIYCFSTCRYACARRRGNSSLRRFSDNAYDGWYRHISA